MRKIATKINYKMNEVPSKKQVVRRLLRVEPGDSFNPFFLLLDPVLQENVVLQTVRLS